MQLPIFLADSASRYSSPLFALFLAFAIAAVIWLIIWLLSDGDGAEGKATKSSRSSAKSEKPKPAPAKKEAPSKEASDLPEGTDPSFAAASSEEAASLFADELSDGTVKQDPIYGIIYTDAPEEVDDLKRIKGVAKVLEGKLHSIGVYRFKQVAVWTDAACQEFSKLLTFKNRIYTDNWLAQAKALHEEKYDEKL